MDIPQIIEFIFFIKDYKWPGCRFTLKLKKSRQLSEWWFTLMAIFYQFVEVFLDYSWASQHWASLNSFTILHCDCFGEFIDSDLKKLRVHLSERHIFRINSNESHWKVLKSIQAQLYHQAGQIGQIFGAITILLKFKV